MPMPERLLFQPPRSDGVTSAGLEQSRIRAPQECRLCQSRWSRAHRRLLPAGRIGSPSGTHQCAWRLLAPRFPRHLPVLGTLSGGAWLCGFHDQLPADQARREELSRGRARRARGGAVHPQPGRGFQNQSGSHCTLGQFRGRPARRAGRARRQRPLVAGRLSAGPVRGVQQQGEIADRGLRHLRPSRAVAAVADRQSGRQSG